MTAAASPTPRFAILASGTGSNAEALMVAFREERIPAELGLLISNVAHAQVLERADHHGVPRVAIPSKGIARAEHERLMLKRLAEEDIDHLLLAGYMRLLTPEFVRAWPGHILNIHPSLLPEFRGLDAPKRQWEAGVSVAGATVHFVDEGCDTGPILLQGTIDVRGDEDADALAERVKLEVEHVIYPRAVRLFLERLERGFDPTSP